MRRRRSLAAAFAAGFLLGGAAPSADAVQIASVPQTVPSTGTQVQNGRIFRDGIASDCDGPAAPKNPPTLDAQAGPFHFIDHTFQSVLDNPICVTVDLQTACTGSNTIFSVAYAGTFDPTHPLTRYAADMGGSPPGATSYSFTAGVDARLSIVVHEVVANAGCSAYTLNVSSRGPWAIAKPSILGTPAVGTSLDGTDAGWKPPAPAIQRRWRRCSPAGEECSDIPGATGPTYTVTGADLGHTLRFRNTATDSDGTSVSESALVEPFLPFETKGTESLGVGDRIQKGIFVRNGVETRCGAPTSAPAVLLPTDNFLFDAFPVGTLLNEPICLVARAHASCSGGITLAAYAPAFEPTSGITTAYAGNSGKSFGEEQAVSSTLPPGGVREFTVSRGNTGGFCGQYSLTLGADGPYATARPSIAGVAAEGATLTAGNGAWSGTPAFGHSWLRCNVDGAGCTQIDGATGPSYTPTAADVGRRLRVRVTATQGRSVSSDSAATEVVAAGSPGGGGAGGVGSAGTTGTPLDQRPPKAKLALAPTTLRKVVKSGRIPVTVMCDEQCTFSVRAEVAKKLRRRLGGVRIASGRGSGQAGRRATVKLKLTRKARKALRRQRSLAFTLSATAVDSAGNHSTASRKLEIKR